MALVKTKPLAIVGIVLVLAGIGTIVRRTFLVPIHREQTNIGDQMVITETKRVVRVPLAGSIVLIVAGCGLLYLSTRET